MMPPLFSLSLRFEIIFAITLLIILFRHYFQLSFICHFAIITPFQLRWQRCFPLILPCHSAFRYADSWRSLPLLFIISAACLYFRFFRFHFDYAILPYFADVFFIIFDIDLSLFRFHFHALFSHTPLSYFAFIFRLIIFIIDYLLLSFQYFRHFHFISFISFHFRLIFISAIFWFDISYFHYYFHYFLSSFLYWLLLFSLSLLITLRFLFLLSYWLSLFSPHYAIFFIIFAIMLCFRHYSISFLFHSLAYFHASFSDTAIFIISHISFHLLFSPLFRYFRFRYFHTYFRGFHWYPPYFLRWPLIFLSLRRFITPWLSFHFRLFRHAYFH